GSGLGFGPGPAWSGLVRPGPGSGGGGRSSPGAGAWMVGSVAMTATDPHRARSEEHTSELQSLAYLVCRLLLEKKKKINIRADMVSTHAEPETVTSGEDAGRRT